MYNIFTLIRLDLSAGSFPTLLLGFVLLGGCANTAETAADDHAPAAPQAPVDLAQAATPEDADAETLDGAGDAEDTETPAQAGSPFEEELPEEIRYGHFDQEVLEQVILAEMAGQRGMNRYALDTYLAIARETGDLGIIMRTSRIASFLRDTEASMEMTRLWLEQEPDSAEAYQTLALQMLATGNYQEALSHLASLLEMGEEVDFRIIPARTSIDPDADSFLPALISDFHALREEYPAHESLLLSLARLYEQDGELEAAYRLVRRLTEETGGNQEALIQEIGLLEQMGETEQMLERLRRGVELYPQSRQIRILLGRQMVNRQNFGAAREQFQAIVDQDPEDHDILYSLALINMEMGRLNDAARHFETLQRAAFRPNNVHYYLGYIALQNGDREAAINHYQKVDAGSNFLQAQRDLTLLLIEEERYSEAQQRLQRMRYTNPEYNLPLYSMEASILLEQDMRDAAETVLDKALADFPDNVQLLYLRATLHTERDELARMEEDLRRIIELEPDNPIGYNTLGYVLADRTDRHEEAYDLIRKAVELAPDDPAIIDSLGWVQYRLGMLEQARKNLENAFRLYPDHEVAAHLGEVLWVMGEKREATRIWEQALEEQPDSDYIRDTMQRLMPDEGE